MIQSPPRFVAITGREGSGKDSYGNYLAEHGFMHASAGDTIREYARSLGREGVLSRELLSSIGDEMKQRLGAYPITALHIQRYQDQRRDFPSGLVISGLRRVHELTAFKAQGATSLWIAADDQRRYLHQQLRKRDDSQDYEEFIAHSNHAYYGDVVNFGTGVNLKAIHDLADCVISNSGTLEDLYSEANAALSIDIR